jgi:hypothetical protein
VQFAAALVLSLHGRGLRPRLEGPSPPMRYLPLLHPASATRINFS